MRRALLVLLAICSACHNAPEQKLSVYDQRQAVLNTIADKCGVSRNTFRLIGDDKLQMQPPADASYESVDCALARLKESKLPVEVGFVGNEYYMNEAP